jgi:hypothetical protein
VSLEQLFKDFYNQFLLFLNGRDHAPHEAQLMRIFVRVEWPEIFGHPQISFGEVVVEEDIRFPQKPECFCPTFVVERSTRLFDRPIHLEQGRRSSASSILSDGAHVQGTEAAKASESYPPGYMKIRILRVMDYRSFILWKKTYGLHRLKFSFRIKGKQRCFRNAVDNEPIVISLYRQACRIRIQDGEASTFFRLASENPRDGRWLPVS